ncbi:programmed cell death protein 2 [Coniochaeta sp. 2T2.1]|nr:programmed cell death protein 2 [Coniochaeta sp. 2T2.1]
MAIYDSESDDGYEEEYQETDVLLGYASTESKGETLSRLGGRPDWLDPSKPASLSLAKCKSCRDPMVLLLQLNAELPKQFPTHERRLYVFACRRKSCRRKEGSIRAVRGTRVTGDAPEDKKEKEKEKKAEENRKEAQAPAVSTGLGESLFGVKAPAGAGAGAANPFANPFSTGSSANPFAKPQQKEEGKAANPFGKAAETVQKTVETAATKTAEAAQKTVDAAVAALPRTFAETLSLNNTQPAAGPPPPPEPWPEESALPPAYPVSWISDAEYEVLEPTSLPKVSQAIEVMDVDTAEGSGSGGGGKEDDKVFESSMDSTFQKFADRVGQNPDQVIRYEYGGQPLLYAKGDEVAKMMGEIGSDGKVKAARGMPRCQNCGSRRIFEVQLMPVAIEELEAEEDGLDGMDWGTVIVGVCERDCVERGQKAGEAGYLEEWAGVQWEELTMKR